MKRTVRTFLLGAFWLVSAIQAHAQIQTPEQLELFRNLTPEQQRAVMEELAAANSDSPAGDEQEVRTRDPQIRAPGPRQVAQALGDMRIPVMQPADTVLIEVAARETHSRALSRPEQERLDRLVELIRSRNPYRLDRSARLLLPGISPIELAGLNEKQATQRLSSEPSLLDLSVSVTRLPLEKTGVAGLKRFGYDLFDDSAAGFVPVTDVPVPSDYVVGPGDRLNVQLFGGSQNRTHRLTVNRDGTISFPELGPISVGGLTFNAARERIERRVEQQMIGVRANVSMGETRAIRILVTGDARRPGSYTVDGLATIISALYASGGVNEIGTLRDIQLKRRGVVVRRLDFYDLLINGDTSDDVTLLPGDVIHIPPVGPTVAVEGEVKRPAIYELRGETSVREIVEIAGGLTPDADTSRSSLTRIDQGRRVVVDVSLDGPLAATHLVGNGDVLRVSRLRPQVEGVELEGHVHRPGPVAWREELRLSHVISSVDELPPNADLGYILIRRETGPDRRVSVHSADLRAALAAPGSTADPLLQRRDRIFVFDLATSRERIIQPLLQELQLQASLYQPTEIVEVGGRVKVPGKVPLEPGMRVSDLLRAGGGLDSAAYSGEAELTRYTLNDAGERQTEVVTINLAALQRGDTGVDVLLKSDDHLIVRETPDWTDRETVTLRGEVRLPGVYTIRRGETLWQVLERAGGLTTLAFPEGSAFTREDLRQIQQEQLDRLSVRTRQELASLALQAANAGQASASEALQTGRALVTQLESARATGRFIIDLPSLLAEGAGSAKDVLLRNGDELYIPKLRQEISVIGEVQNATSHLYSPRLRLEDYLVQSGGTTKKADRSRIYIVRADGSSVAIKGEARFARTYNVAIKPGDTIVVPLDTERMPRLPFWQGVTQILYNLAVSVAAINSF